MTDADMMGEPEEIALTAMISMYLLLLRKETDFAGGHSDAA